MDQVAHIRYEGGALLLPAQNPYDREIVFEEAKFCARRYGIASMQLGRKQLGISISEADARIPCAKCGKPIGLVSFLVDRQRFCTPCAKWQF
jgi:hypothetical protein